ncbi:class I SAM-dependent rRNA methyltransferase [Fastidiosibacter lacustris]|uniref:class I SAM-dependent rRNA methyltransferase n=1 Tax=Fastidiosibacter lacustris TaxID=2056695 RepID=UPI000E341932|nr:class I SAM-dependent methyltransferase [Fastidiosibacter lacustris]
MQLTEITLVKKIKNYHVRSIFYSNEIEHLDQSKLNAQGCSLVQCKQRLALYSKHQLMAVRVSALSIEEIVIHGLEKVIIEFLEHLYQEKEVFKFVQCQEAFRLCHGDHDGLPGITIDCYGAVNVVQSSAASADLLMPFVIKALSQLMPAVAVFERSTGQVREQEGLQSIVQWQYLQAESIQTTKLAGNNLSFDLVHGQKTGLFIDQRCNLIAFQDYLTEQLSSMLDVCCYMGAWSVTASQQLKVFTLIDQSEKALNMAKHNIEQAASGKVITLLHGDMFEALKSLTTMNRYYDVVVADPPAFAKSKKHLAEAIRAYQRLYRLSLACLNKGGLFIACSCSRHLTEELFFEIIQSLGVNMILLHKGYSSPCHTQSVQVDYHDYLKCYIFKLR